MTQIAEDLRAPEPADALDPALRAKILGIAPNPNDADAVGAPLAAPSSPNRPSRPTPQDWGPGGGIASPCAGRWPGRLYSPGSCSSPCSSGPAAGWHLQREA